MFSEKSKSPTKSTEMENYQVKRADVVEPNAITENSIVEKSSDYHISSTLASSIITDHDSNHLGDATNSLQILQKRAEEVLDSASQSFSTGNLIDELSYRTGAFFNDGSASDDPSLKHRCRFCGKVFGSDSALQIHLRSHTGERPFKCNLCPSSFTTKGNLKVHYQRHTETSSPMNLMEATKNELKLPFDFRMHANQFNAESVSKPLQHEAADLRTTRNNEEKESKSLPFNLKNFPKIDELPMRPEKHFEIEQPSRNFFNFDNDFTSSRKKAWEKYMEIVQTPEASKLQSDEANRPDPNKCPLCNRILSCRSALRQHYRTHTGERPFRCRICGRSFTTKGNLKTHISVHKINPLLNPVHSCTICHKKYSNARALQQHTNTHTGAPIEMTIDQIRAAEVREFMPNDYYGSNSSVGDFNEISTRENSVELDLRGKTIENQEIEAKNESIVNLSDSDDSKKSPIRLDDRMNDEDYRREYAARSPDALPHYTDPVNLSKMMSTERTDFFPKFSPMFGASPIPLPAPMLSSNFNPMLSGNPFNPVGFSTGMMFFL